MLAPFFAVRLPVRGKSMSGVKCFPKSNGDSRSDRQKGFYANPIAGENPSRSGILSPAYNLHLPHEVLVQFFLEVGRMDSLFLLGILRREFRIQIVALIKSD